MVRVISAFLIWLDKGYTIVFSALKTIVYIHFDHCFSFMSAYSSYSLYLLFCCFYNTGLSFLLKRLLGSSHDTFSAFSFCSAREWRMVYWEMPWKVCMGRGGRRKTEEESLVENNDNIDGMWSCM